jgi:hypothetical protein
MTNSETFKSMLTDQRKQIAAVEKVVNKIIKLDQSREANLDKLEAELSRLERAFADKHISDQTKSEMQVWIRNLKESLSQTRQELDRKFGSKLAALLVDDQIEVTGQLPELKAGLFTVEVDPSRNRVVVWYGPKQERIEILPRSPELVAKALRDKLQSMKSRDLDDQDYLNRCLSAYKRVITLNGSEFGTPAPISQLLAELAFLMQGPQFITDPDEKNYRSYSRAQFSFDLHRLNSRRIGNLELRLVTATREKTGHRKNFLWVPQSERGEGSYYSDLWFREEQA